MNSIAESADESDDGITEDEEQRYRELESELSGIQNRPAVLTEDQKDAAIDFLDIGEDGKPSVHHQAYMVQIGRAHDGTTVTNAHLECRLLLPRTRPHTITKLKQARQHKQ